MKITAILFLYTKNISVALPNLPSEWQNKKAVFISDIHLGTVYDQNFSEEIVSKINEINCRQFHQSAGQKS